jgi:hypothetical protein
MINSTNPNATELANEVITRIEQMLDRANEKRRTRILSMGDVLRVLEKVVFGRSQDQWQTSWDHGGMVANAYRYPARTTVVVAARLTYPSVLGVFVGIAWCNARRPSPGRTFPSLGYWQSKSDRPGGDHEAKFREWTELGPDSVAEISPAEIDALIESGMITDPYANQIGPLPEPYDIPF